MSDRILIGSSVFYSTSDPTATENPPSKNMLWVNITTGSLFTCKDNTPDANVWVEHKTSEAGNILTDVSKFNRILTSSDTDVQKALDTIDDYAGIYKGSTAPTNSFIGQLWWDSSVNSNLIYVKMYDGSTWRDFKKVWIASTTINLSSASDIYNFANLVSNSIIPYGIAITGQIADGTYTITETIGFSGISGGGNCYLNGNSSDNSASMTKSVKLDASSYEINVFELKNLTVGDFRIQYIDIKGKTDTQHNYLVYGCGNLTYVFVDYCYIHGNSDSYGFGTLMNNMDSSVRHTYFASIKVAIDSIGGAATESYYNYSDSSNEPKYGLYTKGGFIFKRGDQPTGSVANEYSTGGGQIWG